MTRHDRLEILRRACDEHGQAEVARRIGYNPSGINQVLAGTYKANPDKILELVAAEFSSDTVNCPVMGEVCLADCLEARRRADMPFFPSSGQTAELHRTCPECKKGGVK